MRGNSILAKKVQSKLKLLGRIGLTTAFLFVLFIRLQSAQWFEQHYSRGLYPKIANILVPFSDSFPFSLSLLFILLIFIWVIISLVISWKNRKSIFSWVQWTMDNLIAIVLLTYVLFFVLWGANYQRLTVEEQFNLANLEVTQADVESFLNRLEPILINFNSSRDQDTALISIKKSLKETIESITTVNPRLPKIKQLPKGSLIRFGNSSGVSSPFLLEAHVDASLSDTFFIRVAAHELAHIAGYAGEADAEFVSEFAVLRGPDDFARYSVALEVYISLLNKLDDDLRKNYYQALPKQVKDDIKAIYIPFKKYAAPQWFQDLQKIAYGSYLKSQGVSAGYADYSRDIKLLLIAYKQGYLLQ